MAKTSQKLKSKSPKSSKNSKDTKQKTEQLTDASARVVTMPLTFLSYDQKTQINAKFWVPSDFGQPKADALVGESDVHLGQLPASTNTQQQTAQTPFGIIQIVHGMSEYIDRYDDLASFFVQRGFIVCAEDHIGHGKSVSNPQHFGHMPVHGGKDILIHDVDHLRRIASALYPNLPYILYGHSMGSFITRAYLARHGQGLAAAVLSGTGNVPRGASLAGRSLARFLAKTRGETYRSALIDGMGAGSYSKSIKDARTDFDWLSTDPTVVDTYIKDDLCGFMFTVGGYATLLDLTAEIVTPQCAGRVPHDLPIFLVAGDKDPVGDNGKGVLAAADLLCSAGVEQIDAKLYEGMRHEIHNERGHAKVYEDIASWIEGVLA